jgi:hypothetical protein
MRLAHRHRVTNDTSNSHIPCVLYAQWLTLTIKSDLAPPPDPSCYKAPCTDPRALEQITWQLHIQFLGKSNFMPTENESLLIAIISQLKDTKLDYKILARDLGLNTPGAASKRWQRYRKRLMETKQDKASKPKGVQKSTTPMSSTDIKKKTPKPTGNDKIRSLDVKEIAAAPLRKLPNRKARAVKVEPETPSEDSEESESGMSEDDVQEEEELNEVNIKDKNNKIYNDQIEGFFI